LARSDIHVGQLDAHSRQMNDVEGLSLSTKVFNRVRNVMGLDVVLFECLCKATRKVLDSSDFQPGGESSAITTDIRESTGDLAARGVLVKRAHAMLRTAFGELTNTTSSAREAASVLKLPTLAYDVSAVHIANYVRVLGHLGDTDEMVRVMQWMVRTWDDETVLEDAKDVGHSQHAVLTRAWTFFRAVAENCVPRGAMKQLESELRKLNESKGCTWSWPTEEDVEEYMQYDQRRRPQEFWAVARRQVATS